MGRLLTVGEVSDYLQLNQRTVIRMAQAGDIPAVKIARQWRFRPELVESWLESRSGAAGGAAVEPAQPSAEIQLSTVFYTHAELLDLLAGNRLSALREVVSLLAAEQKVSSVNPFLQMLYEREAMLSTGIGNGVAIPHARHAVRGLFEAPLVVLARSMSGIDWRAVDGLPVHLIFLLISPDDGTHLRLLSRLSCVLRLPSAFERLKGAGSSDEVIRAFGEMEQTLPASLSA